MVCRDFGGDLDCGMGLEDNLVEKVGGGALLRLAQRRLHRIGILFFVGAVTYDWNLLYFDFL